ncbi:hypothetical protein WICPIJ_001947 [Wickerhamomyces pijperi]|uniref:Uncharacterized protein n=1 Tax=Wickerhamomyces pijperi TaxID=599730 RepID=A0A9P8QCP6_WICPI|nr:hypothetical protein WICPIJ_001947 [Wickerhamomyces pijperi]
MMLLDDEVKLSVQRLESLSEGIQDEHEDLTSLTLVRQLQDSLHQVQQQLGTHDLHRQGQSIIFQMATVDLNSG